MASTKDMMWFPGVCFPGSVCAKASGLGMVRQYPVAVQLFLPSPLVGEGGEIERSEMKPGEGSVSADADPSSGASRHLLPQGEKEEGIEIPAFAGTSLAIYPLATSPPNAP